MLTLPPSTPCAAKERSRLEKEVETLTAQLRDMEEEALTVCGLFSYCVQQGCRAGGVGGRPLPSAEH